MQLQASSLIFRRLTASDLGSINSIGSRYKSGGGQSYIDFAGIEIDDWLTFLGAPTGTRTKNRSEWEIQVHSLGLAESQTAVFSNRRANEVNLTSQKIESRKGNRIAAWRSFPSTVESSIDLVIAFIVRAGDGTFWAGWFLQNETPKDLPIPAALTTLFTERAGYIDLRRENISIDTTKHNWPFAVSSEYVREEELLEEDTSVKLNTATRSAKAARTKEKIIKLRERNNVIVRKLKQLYGGRCQISGVKMTFRKIDGKLYCEGHHLIPLGDEGSDSFANVIIVSPLIHRMLHYAKVEGIDLSKIKNGKLQIKINNVPYDITWHPDHLKQVEESIKS